MPHEPCVLFSPVGGTDPITEMYDGSLLHICRHHRPECVMLYLSAEMLEYHRKDDRYRRALQRLMDEDGFFMDILCEERPELHDPHLFDIFYADFEDCLKKLHERLPNHRLLVNLSSGTPAMKSALVVLTHLAAVPITGIQVSSPNRRSNKPRREIVEYDLDTNWELDEDRRASKSRCAPSMNENLRKKLLRQTIAAHLSDFNYEAAKTVAEQMGALLCERARALLDAAVRRSRNEGARLPTAMKDELGFIRGSGREQSIFEYLLILQTHHQRGRTTDFLRGMTPALYQLSLYALRQRAGLDMEAYCNSAGRLDSSRLRQARPDIYDMLCRQYPYGMERNPFLSSELCCYLMDQLCPGERVTQTLGQLREAERCLRNAVAHDIKPLTDGQFLDACAIFGLKKKRASSVPEQTWAALKAVTEDVFTCRSLPWDAYETMNMLILQAIDAGLA